MGNQKSLQRVSQRLPPEDFARTLDEVEEYLAPDDIDSLQLTFRQRSRKSHIYVASSSLDIDGRTDQIALLADHLQTTAELFDLSPRAAAHLAVQVADDALEDPVVDPGDDEQ